MHATTENKKPRLLLFALFCLNRHIHAHRAGQLLEDRGVRDERFDVISLHLRCRFVRLKKRERRLDRLAALDSAGNKFGLQFARRFARQRSPTFNSSMPRALHMRLAAIRDSKFAALRRQARCLLMHFCFIGSQLR